MIIWKLEDSGILNQKATQNFFFTCSTRDWGKIISSNFIFPVKTLVFWKFLRSCLLTDMDATKRGVSLSYIYFLCRLQVEDSDHLFF